MENLQVLRVKSTASHRRRTLVVFDFDGFLVNSYAVIRDALGRFGLDVGAEERFRNRRKFLKYLGGGKELLPNLVKFALPRRRQLRAALTEEYLNSARVYPEFVTLLNAVIGDPSIQCGIVSRNFAVAPGPTIRHVLRCSGVEQEGLDFVIPIPVGARKTEVLAGMRASQAVPAVLAADEIGDYRAGIAAGYRCLMATYGFDTRHRLLAEGTLPPDCLYDTPHAAAHAIAGLLRLHVTPTASAISEPDFDAPSWEPISLEIMGQRATA